MNVFLILKCGFIDAYNFIKQIGDINEVNKIFVFRDSESLESRKAQYILPPFKKYSILKHLSRLIQIIRKYKLKPKLIIGIYEIPHGLIAMLAGKILRTPSVVSIIGNPAYKKLRKGLWLKLMMWILKNCNFITVTGNNSKFFLVEKGIGSDKVYILPNTMDLSPFSNLNITPAYDIISLGRISKEKHIEILIQIIFQLKKTQRNIRAAIAGDGPEFENIKRLIAELELQENIDLLGYIPDRELANFFNNGRVFILTSETEGFPRTIVQAAACGTPVIASKVGDIDDVILHNENGFLVNDYSCINDYIKAYLTLVDNPELYTRFSLELNDKVRDTFITEKASAVWKEIMNKIN